MAKHERHPELDLVAGYVLQALSPRDEARLLAHLMEGCEECEAAMRDASDATVAIGGGAPAAMPSDALRSRVLSDPRISGSAGGAGAGGAGTGSDVGRDSGAGSDAETNADTDADARSPRAPGRTPLRPRDGARAGGGKAIAGMLAAACVVLMFGNYWFWQKAGEFRAERDAVQRTLREVEAELSAKEWIPKMVTAPGTDCYDLALTGSIDAPLNGTACFARESGAAVVLLAELRPPSGRDYELWVLRGSVPTSLGVIRADEEGRAAIRFDAIPDAGAITAFAVSLEPTGGSPGPAPTGPVVMVAPVTG